MKRLIIFNLVLLVSIFAQGQCAYQQYHKFGYRGTSFKILEDINGGNVFVFYDATIDTNSIDGQDDREIWIIKNDSCGNRLWKKHMGFSDSVSIDFFADVIYTPDSNLLILGTGEYTDQGGIYSGTIFKIDLDGNVLWKKAYGGKHGLVPSSIVYNPHRKTYIVSGRIERIYPPDGLWNRGYLFEIDSLGIKLNERDIIFNNDSIDAKKNSLRVSDIGIFQDSTIIAIVKNNHDSGNYLMKFDSKLDIIYEKQLLPPDIAFVAQDIYFNKNEMLMVVAGTDSNTSISGSWLARLDGTGSIKQRWLLKDQNNFEHDFGPGVFYPTNDSGYVFGTHLYKYDKNLKREWSKKIVDDPFYLRLYSIIQLKSGAYAGVGESDYNSNGKYMELYIMQTHPNGGFVGLQSTQNLKENSSISVYPNPSNGIFTIQTFTLASLSAQVYNVTGKIICNQNFVGQVQLNLSAHAQGIYFVKVVDEAGNIVHSSKVALRE